MPLIFISHRTLLANITLIPGKKSHVQQKAVLSLGADTRPGCDE